MQAGEILLLLAVRGKLPLEAEQVQDARLRGLQQLPQHPERELPTLQEHGIVRMRVRRRQHEVLVTERGKTLERTEEKIELGYNRRFD